MQLWGGSRRSEHRRRRGELALALSLFAASGPHAIAGCGKQLGLADIDAGAPPTDGVSADGSAQGGTDGAEGGNTHDGASDGDGGKTNCLEGRLVFGDLTPLEFQGVSSAVVNPFVLGNSFFGERLVDETRSLIVGQRSLPNGPFSVETVPVLGADTAEITPAGFHPDEVFFGDPPTTRLRVTRKSGTSWQTPSDVSGIGASLRRNDRYPSLTSDGTLLLFLRVEREENGERRMLVQAMRTAGGDFTNPTSVGSNVPPGLTYPAITPDGLGLLYTLGGKTYFAERKTRESELSLAEAREIEIRHGSSPIRARSISADGCELYVTVGAGPSAKAYVARRQ